MPDISNTTMRTLIDLPDHDLAAMGEIAGRTGHSRAAVMRPTVAEDLARNARRETVSACGLWDMRGPDGVSL